MDNQKKKKIMTQLYLENEEKEKNFPKNPDDISGQELKEHFDLNNDGKVSIEEYAEHINYHCDNPETLDDELQQADFERGFKYKKGGSIPKGHTKELETEGFIYYVDEYGESPIMIRKSDGSITSDNYFVENDLYERMVEIANGREKYVYLRPESKQYLKEFKDDEDYAKGGVIVKYEDVVKIKRPRRNKKDWGSLEGQKKIPQIVYYTKGKNKEDIYSAELVEEIKGKGYRVIRDHDYAKGGETFNKYSGIVVNWKESNGQTDYEKFPKSEYDDAVFLYDEMKEKWGQAYITRDEDGKVLKGDKFAKGGTIKGEDLKKYIEKEDYGDDLSFVQFINNNDKYVLENIDIDTQIQKDSTLSDYINNDNEEFTPNENEGIWLNKTPIIIGDSNYGSGVVLDGYHRIKQAQINKEKTIPAFVKTSRYAKGGKMMSEEDNPCWEGYEMYGMKKKGGKEVPNCVPEKKKLAKGGITYLEEDEYLIRESGNEDIVLKSKGKLFEFLRSFNVANGTKYDTIREFNEGETKIKILTSYEVKRLNKDDRVYCSSCDKPIDLKYEDTDTYGRCESCQQQYPMEEYAKGGETEDKRREIIDRHHYAKSIGDEKSAEEAIEEYKTYCLVQGFEYGGEVDVDEILEKVKDENDPESAINWELAVRGVVDDELEDEIVQKYFKEYYRKGGLTPEKANKMLEDGEVHGKLLTDKQKRYFHSVASKNEKKVRDRVRAKRLAKGGMTSSTSRMTNHDVNRIKRILDKNKVKYIDVVKGDKGSTQFISVIVSASKQDYIPTHIKEFYRLQSSNPNWDARTMKDNNKTNTYAFVAHGWQESEARKERFADKVRASLINKGLFPENFIGSKKYDRLNDKIKDLWGDYNVENASKKIASQIQKYYNKGGEIGSIVRISKTPYMTSFSDLYDKDLKIKDVKTTNFASGVRKEFIVELNGKTYEIPQDMLENFEKGGKINVDKFSTRKEKPKSIKINRNKDERMVFEEKLNLRFSIQSLESELGDIEETIKENIRETEQTAEPEGGPIASRLGAEQEDLTRRKLAIKDLISKKQEKLDALDSE